MKTIIRFGLKYSWCCCLGAVLGGLSPTFSWAMFFVILIIILEKLSREID